MTKVFIDGSAGTTGLRIEQRLLQRSDLQLIKLSEELRKDDSARRDALNSADIAFLCLPDAAAIQAVEMAENPALTIIDTSTAHRTNPTWTYGFPELTGKREAIQRSRRIANPGCHASGFIALIAPLVERGILCSNALLSAVSLTGYSGGGKKMIAQYESCTDGSLDAPRQYALTQQHKHLKEMVALCGIDNAPVFCPIVGNFYSGMQVTVPLTKENVGGADLLALYRDYYSTGIVKVHQALDGDGMLSAGAYSGRDDMGIYIYGNADRILLTACYDNLGKGASGAAIQNMNIALGVTETTGLVTE